MILSRRARASRGKVHELEAPANPNRLPRRRARLARPRGRAIGETLVVVNCGGRTRSIVGAQTLIDAGLPNGVVSLKDGTQGWHLAGLDVLRGDDGGVDRLTPADLAGLLEQGAAVVVDFATSRSYRAGHIPGAWFAVRGRLDADAIRLPTAPLYVATSPDDGLAALAARELAAATGQRVKVLEGGTDAWRVAGLPIEADEERLASRDDDVFLKAFERQSHREAAMREYLRWEVDLVDAAKRDGTLHFRL